MAGVVNAGVVAVEAAHELHPLTGCSKLTGVAALQASHAGAAVHVEQVGHEASTTGRNTTCDEQAEQLSTAAVGANATVVATGCDETKVGANPTVVATGCGETKVGANPTVVATGCSEANVGAAVVVVANVGNVVVVVANDCRFVHRRSRQLSKARPGYQPVTGDRVTVVAGTTGANATVGVAHVEHD